MATGAGRRKRTSVGRPSKGKRDAILARPHEELALVIRRHALEERLSNGEYMVKLAALQLDMPQYIPEPSIRTVRPVEAEPVFKDGRDSILAKPPVAFGKEIKRRARAADLHYGEYMVALAAQALGRADLAPQPADQLDFPKEDALTAA